MPAQPLLRAPPLVDEIVAVIDQQLQLAVDPLVRPRPLRSGSRRAARAIASASIGSDLPRVRPARRSGTVSFGGTRTSSSPTPSSCRSSQPRQLPAVLDRPQPLTRRAPRPSRAARRCRPGPPSRRAAGRPRRRRPPSPTACARPAPITIIQIASIAVGGDRRADRPQSRRKPRSYQVTLDGLGSAAATQRWKSDLTGRHSESSQPPPTESAPHTGRHHADEMTLSSGMNLL